MYWTGIDGNWHTTTDPIVYNTKQSLAVTYDSDLNSNTPIIYVDGSSQTITEITGPDGTRSDDDSDTLFLGNRSDSSRTYDGEQANYVMWDTILSATEIGALSRGVSPIAIRPNNIVFWLPCWGNQSPEPDWNAQTSTGAVTGTTRGVNGNYELVENYL